MRLGVCRPLLALLLCLTVVGLSGAVGRRHGAPTRRCGDGSTGRSPAMGTHSIGRHVIAATPLWNGDVFTVRPPRPDTGGEGRVPPYVFSSASGPRRGWFQPHSNTDPDVQGVTVVDDPAGLTSSTAPGSVRKVIKLTDDEQRAYRGEYVRTEIRGPDILGPGQVRWIIAEVYLPPGLPTMPTQAAWWTILSIFGPPYRGASPDSFHIKRSTRGARNDIAWDLPSGRAIWRTPATTGVWHIIARRIRFDTDPRKGFSEVWYSRRAPDGDPTGPLTRQVLGGTAGVPRGFRRHYATLDPRVNWNGTSNHPALTNYHSARLWPDCAVTSLYFARHRVYDGAVPVKRIDPYYTGLR